MVNVFNDPESTYDLNKRAGATLQTLVDEEGKTDKKALVTDELSKKRILEAESQRMLSRVLFITTDVRYLEESYVERVLGVYRQVFDEMHVLVIHNRLKQDKGVKRLGKNLWLYNVAARSILGRLLKARHYVRGQLLFGEEFRPDIVVALEPKESALLAEMLSDKYDRPWQLHVLDRSYVMSSPGNKPPTRWQRMILKSVLKAAPSIKAADEKIKEAVLRRKVDPSVVEVLPRFYNISELKELTIPDTQKLFDQFKFTILYIGELSSESLLYQVLDAARSLLATPSIGLAVLGTGSQLAAIKERAAMFGVVEQVLFLGSNTDQITALSSADILVVPEISAEHDELIIKAAALGTAILCAKNELRETLFVDGESAFLYDAGDMAAIEKKLKKFMNDNAYRTQLRVNAKNVVTEQIVDDPELYAIAYRNAVEDVLFAKEEAREKHEIAGVVKKAQAIAATRQDKVTDVEGVTIKLPKHS